jgi:hypothetical protein
VIGKRQNHDTAARTRSRAEQQRGDESVPVPWISTPGRAPARARARAAPIASRTRKPDIDARYASFGFIMLPTRRVVTLAGKCL